MQIRKMLPKDRDIYLMLADEFYHTPAVLHPVSREILLRGFNALQDIELPLFGYLLEQEDTHQPIGYILVALSYSTEIGGPCLWIEDFYIREAFRGQGFGRATLLFLRKQYSKQCLRFRLEMQPSNEAARHLYEKAGFTTLSYEQMVLDHPAFDHEDTP